MLWFVLRFKIILAVRGKSLLRRGDDLKKCWQHINDTNRNNHILIDSSWGLWKYVISISSFSFYRPFPTQADCEMPWYLQAGFLKALEGKDSTRIWAGTDMSPGSGTRTARTFTGFILQGFFFLGGGGANLELLALLEHTLTLLSQFWDKFKRRNSAMSGLL